ncbi:Rne/Rng family ribonuclease [Halovulum sp. GXIMD14793]
MAKKMLIDATHAEETRVVVVEGNKVDEFDFESLNKRQLAGNIYLAKVTRVEPSLQAAFVDYGGNRHGFLAFSEIHPDYYQIPTADREALLAEEAELNRTQDDEEEEKPTRRRPRSRRRSRSKAANEGAPSSTDEVVTADVDADDDGSTLVEDLPEARDAAVDTNSDEAEAADEDTSAEAAPGDQAEAEAADTDDAQDAGTEGQADEKDENIDQVGASAVEEEIAPRRTRVRRYKIQEVIKVRQILLVQVVKEERGNKGAALTTYLSLAGRYCVLMPNTARGGGISRKITNVNDRKKLKDIASEITVPKGAGLIIRTAGAQRTKAEIKRDYEFLLRQWEQIKDLTMQSIAPAPIYEEGSLIKRSIRDLYSKDIDEIFVEGERGYREAKDYMKMLMPSHAKNVKEYTDALPLFARYQVENYLSAMFNPVVQLRSGGYIVIDVTEALVAVDVNSGRSTKEGSIEDTALKTNLEAAEELARQARLRDLAGLIVIDFIDMEDRKNNNAVEKRLKDKLKTDRARIQVGRISGFGLLEMSRQRLRPGMLEATTAPCPHCHGTGRVRSDDSLTLAILRELEEEGVRRRAREVLVTAPVNIANYMLNAKREHVAMIESRFGLSIRVEGDPQLISPDYRMERLKTATRIIPAAELTSGVIDSVIEMDEEEEPTEADVEALAPEEQDEKPKKRRRRRRRRKSTRDEDGETSQEAQSEGADAEETADAPQDQPAEAAEAEAPAEKPKRTRSRTRSRKKPSPAAETPSAEAAEATDNADGDTADAPAKEEAKAAPVPEPTVAEAAETPAEPAKPARKQRVRVSAETAMATKTEDTAEPPAKTESGDGEKRGWWSRTLGR